MMKSDEVKEFARQHRVSPSVAIEMLTAKKREAAFIAALTLVERLAENAGLHNSGLWHELSELSDYLRSIEA